MTDYFELLGLPKKPWLPEEEVKAAFISKAAKFHPDRHHEATDEDRSDAQQQYTLLNEAQLCLGQARSRLRHLLELERGTRITDLQEMPDELVNLFKQITGQFKAADEFLKRRSAITSPLLLVALLDQSDSIQKSLNETKLALLEWKTRIEECIHEIDSVWQNGTNSNGKLLDRLETSYRILSFLERWQEQAQNRLLHLLT